MREEKKYDPELCITAGELRERGVPVPDDIPECGWILRKDFLLAVSKMTTDVQTINKKERTFDMTHSIQLPPFFWIKINGTVEV